MPTLPNPVRKSPYTKIYRRIANAENGVLLSFGKLTAQDVARIRHNLHWHVSRGAYGKGVSVTTSVQNVVNGHGETSKILYVTKGKTE